MCSRRGGAWKVEGDGDRLAEEEEYVFDGKQTCNGTKEWKEGVANCFTFWLQHRREVRGRGRGRVWCNFIIVSLLPLSRRGWIGANNDGGRSIGQKRTRIQGMTD